LYGTPRLFAACASQREALIVVSYPCGVVERALQRCAGDDDDDDDDDDDGGGGDGGGGGGDGGGDADKQKSTLEAQSGTHAETPPSSLLDVMLT